ALALEHVGVELDHLAALLAGVIDPGRRQAIDLLPALRRVLALLEVAVGAEVLRLLLVLVVRGRRRGEQPGARGQGTQDGRESARHGVALRRGPSANGPSPRQATPSLRPRPVSP